MEIRLTQKQGEYVREAHHRWNFAVGAVRSGKSYLATLYTIPKIKRELKLKSLVLYSLFNYTIPKIKRELKLFIVVFP